MTSGSPAPEVPRGAGNTLVARGYRGTWADLPLPRLPPVAAALVDGHAAAAAAAWEHALTPRETLVVGAGRVDQEQAEELRAGGFTVVPPSGPLPATAVRSPDPGRLWLMTSGSTGRPKRVAHTLESLTTVAADQPARRWLCPYTPGAYAWWQVVTLSLAHPGQDVVFVEPDELAGWPELALTEGVTAVSGTPTFWRQALLGAGDTVARLPLRQVTLGGEPVDQSILDRLTDLFPTARISWIYASSEAGASIAVHDGRAGFPLSWLERCAPGRPRLSVAEGELLIESDWSADGFSGALPTGDRAEVVDDRVHITGRIAGDEINVGGSKASAAAVRRVLLAHPGVAWAQVRGRRAPLVGSVVTADVVLAGSFTDPTEAAAVPATAPGAAAGTVVSTTGAATATDLTLWCADRLPEHAVPRRIRLLDEIPIKETLKSDV